MLGHIEVSLRPLKFAFVVRPSDKQAIHEAIAYNSSHWGGVFNPIIPAYKRLPNNWEEHVKIKRRTPIKRIIDNYITTFDPDFIIAADKDLNAELAERHPNVIAPNFDMLNLELPAEERYGVNVYEILNYLCRKEFKFKRRHEVSICTQDDYNSHNLFLSAIFGKYTERVRNQIETHYHDFLDIKCNTLSASNLYDYNSFFDPISITRYGLKVKGYNYSPRGHCALIINPTSTLDILDFWNLRALGWSVFPISTSHFDQISMPDFKDFLSRYHYRTGYKDSIVKRGTILKGRQVPLETFKSFISSIETPEFEGDEGYIFSTQEWFPSMWSPSIARHNKTEGIHIYSKTRKHDITGDTERISFKTLDPKITSNTNTSAAKFANEISFEMFGSNDEPLAECIPNGGNEVAWTVSSGGSNWRISRHRLIYTSQHLEWPIHIEIPKAEDIMLAWFRSMGWQVQLSSAGHVAKQVLKQLNGLNGIRTISQPGVIELLNDMAPRKAILQPTVWGKIQRIANNDPFRPAPKRLLKGLIEKNIMKLGATLQCPICQQRSWHSLDDLNYEVKCEKCLNLFSPPTHSTDDIKWAYRSFGPFSLEDSAYGAYSVLLTLKFLADELHDKVTPLMSFTAQKADQTIEADLAILRETRQAGLDNTDLMFAECKTYNSFEKTDIDRMVVLNKNFPDAYIVFAKLSDRLTRKEKRLIKSFIRKTSPKGPYSTTAKVMILTKTELCSHRSLGLNKAYEEAGGRHAEIAGKHRFISSLGDKCDVTQELYLKE